MYGVCGVGWLSCQIKMLSNVPRIRNGVIKNIEVEKDLDTHSSLIPTSALGPRAEGSKDRHMTFPQMKSPRAYQSALV